MKNDDYYRDGVNWRPRYPKLPASTLTLAYSALLIVSATISYVAYITH